MSFTRATRKKGRAGIFAKRYLDKIFFDLLKIKYIYYILL